MGIENFIREAIYKPNDYVVVLATTNHPEKLDPAILDRPSRFDRKYYFTLPSDSERLSYIRKWVSGGGSVSMNHVIRTQTELLLSQISKKEKKRKLRPPVSDSSRRSRR